MLFKNNPKTVLSMFNSVKIGGFRQISISGLKVLRLFLQREKFGSLKTLYCVFFGVKLGFAAYL